MSERKKMKVEKTLEKAKSSLETLRAMHKDGGAAHDAEDFTSVVQEAMLDLNSKETRHYAIFTISEVFKLVKSPEEALPVLLTEDELDRVFGAVLGCVVDGKFDMSPFIQDVFFANLRSAELISKFFGAYAKAGVNRTALKHMLCLFIKFDPSKTLVDKVVNDHRTYLDLIPLIIQYIDVSRLDEDVYAKIYCNCPFFRENVEFRKVGGRNRLDFVQKAIETHMADALTCYCRDRDQRIRLFLAKQVHLNNTPFVSILINDPEDEVRLALIKRMSCADASLYVGDRALDKAANVRLEVFRIFGEVVHQLKAQDPASGMFDHNDQSMVEDGKLMFKAEMSEISTADLQARLLHLFPKICRGCLTCFKDEYISAIGKCGFSLDFLFKHKGIPGLPVYLKTLSFASLDAVPTHLRGFCLEYMFKGPLTAAQITECIQGDTFEVIRHVQDLGPFYDQLLGKMLEISDPVCLEIIAEAIKPLLNGKPCIRKEPSAKKVSEPGSIKVDIQNDTVVENSNIFVPENQNESHFQPLTPCELFINAHTLMDRSEVERQVAESGTETSYPALYFMAYRCPELLMAHQLISAGSVDIPRVIRLLVYMNNPKYIEPSVDMLLGHTLDAATQRFLVTTRTLTATLIYFYCTGLVRVPHRLFFIAAVKCCLLATNEAKVDQIFKKYMKSVSSEAFNSFFSICCILKDCKVSSTETGNLIDGASLILTSIIDAETLPEVSDPARGSKSVKLTKRDKMLSYICSSVIASRDGVVVDVRFEPSEHGFSRLSDSESQMIYIGQVTYE